MPFLTVALRAPDAPAAALANPAAAGNVNNGDHRYLVTFVTTRGETTAGTASAIVTVANNTVNGQVDVTQIPTGDATVTARKLYRTEAAGSTYKLLTTLNDNTTTTYRDNTADASLGAIPPATNGTGLDINASAEEGGKDEIEIGDAARAIDGSYRSTVTARKRAWQVRTAALLRTDADTLEATLKGAAPLPCSGDLLGATVQCFPELTSWTPVAVAGGHRVEVGFTLHEA